MPDVHTERKPLLMSIYDAPLPAPLDAKHPTLGSFGVGFVLAPKNEQSALARLMICHEGKPPMLDNDAPRASALRDLARGNPAARMLRLLESMARGTPDEFSMALLDGGVN